MTTELFVRETGRKYRAATRNDVTAWMQAAIAADIRGATLRSPSDTFAYLQGALELSPAEHFAVIYMDNRHRVIRMEIAFRGTIDNTTCHPREIVRRALELNAAAVVFAHNHPSGVTEPSQADQIISRRLRAALELIDVRVLDSIVIAAGAAPVSLAARGMF